MADRTISHVPMDQEDQGPAATQQNLLPFHQRLQEISQATNPMTFTCARQRDALGRFATTVQNKLNLLWIEETATSSGGYWVTGQAENRVYVQIDPQQDPSGAGADNNLDLWELTGSKLAIGGALTLYRTSAFASEGVPVGPDLEVTLGQGMEHTALLGGGVPETFAYHSDDGKTAFMLLTQRPVISIRYVGDDERGHFLDAEDDQWIAQGPAGWNQLDEGYASEGDQGAAEEGDIDHPETERLGFVYTFYFMTEVSDESRDGSEDGSASSSSSDSQSPGAHH